MDDFRARWRRRTRRLGIALCGSMLLSWPAFGVAVDVLVVDDTAPFPGNPSTAGAYEASLRLLNVGFDVVRTESLGAEPTAGQLAAYPVVIWVTGGFFGAAPGPSAQAEQALASYLDGGGCLHVTSRDYLNPYGEPPTAFQAGYPGFGSLASNPFSEDTRYTGAGGHFAALPPTSLATFQSDSLSAGTASVGLSYTVGGSGAASLFVDTAAVRTALWGFLLGDVVGVNARTQLARAMLTFCGVSAARTGDLAPQGAPDGLITSADAQLAAKMALGLEAENLALDVAPLGSPDGEVTMADALLLLRVAWGMARLPTSGRSLTERLDAGFAAVQRGDRLSARDEFLAAAVSAGNTTSNDADTARFMGAIYRIWSISKDTESDGVAEDGLNSPADFLDGFGCNHTFRQYFGLDDILSLDRFPCRLSGSMPADSPTTGDAQLYLWSVVRPEMQAALVQLDQVSTGFERTWTNEHGRTAESDFGDVLLAKAAVNAGLADIYMQSVYSLDFDIDAELARTGVTRQEFLARNPGLLASTLDDDDRARLQQASSHFAAALRTLDAAIVWMDSTETDDQSDDLVRLGNRSTQNIVAKRDRIAELLDSVENGVPVERTRSDGTTVHIDLKAFFDGVSLRTVLPSFVADDPGSFPDPGFGGVLGGTFDPNQDIAPADGIPDILQ